MSWRKDIADSKGVWTFKGVPFRVDNVSKEFGWNVVAQEKSIPGANWKPGMRPVELDQSVSHDPFIDKGSKGARTFAVEAHFTDIWVLDEKGQPVLLDYQKDRDDFVSAVEEGTPGILQLPLMKPVTVYASRGSIGFSNQAGGFETVSILFIETTLAPAVNTVANDRRRAFDEVESGNEASKSRFTELFDKAAEGASGLATKLSGKLMEVMNRGAAGDQFSDFVSKAMKLSEDARTIIQTPQRFVEEILDVVADLTYAFTNPIDALNAQLFIFETFRDTLVLTGNGSESRRREVANNQAVALAVESACVMQAGITALNAEYETLGDALNIRAEYEAAVRTQRRRLGDVEGYDGVYDSLGKLLGSVTRYINDTANLPSAITVQFGDENPALVIAEDFYGDADRAGELVRRNSVKHPLFCPVEMEVLSR